MAGSSPSTTTELATTAAGTESSRPGIPFDLIVLTGRTRVYYLRTRREGRVGRALCRCSFSRDLCQLWRSLDLIVDFFLLG